MVLPMSTASDEIREEVFAQLWAFSHAPTGMQFLRDNLPTTAAFMEKVHAEVKQTKYGKASEQQDSQPGQVQATAGQQIVGRQCRTFTPAGAKEEVSKITELLRSAGNAALNKVNLTEDLFTKPSPRA